MAGRPAVLRINVIENTRAAQKGLEKTSHAVGGLATAVAGLGLAMGAFDQLQKAVDAASQLQQNTGAVDAVFKRSAATVKAWGEQAATSVGLAASAYDGLAVEIGSQLKGLGVPLKDLGKKTDSLIRLGADLAAMYGGTTAEAVHALARMLVGERDPIERYGVTITQAMIKADLLARGLGKLTGAAKSNAERAAALRITYKKTADAHGQFARESDTLAGAQQRNAAKWENIRAKLGDALLPIVTQVIDAFSRLADTVDKMHLGKALLPLIKKVTDMFTRFADKLDKMKIAEKITPAIEGLSTALSKLLDWITKNKALVETFAVTFAILAVAVGATALVMGILESEFLVVLAPLLAVAAAIALAWQKSATFRDGVKKLGEAAKLAGAILLKAWRDQVLPFIKDKLEPKFKELADDIGSVLAAVKPWIEKHGPDFVAMLKDWLQWIGFVVDRLWDLYEIFKKVTGLNMKGAVKDLPPKVARPDITMSRFTVSAFTLAPPTAAAGRSTGSRAAASSGTVGTARNAALAALTPQSQVIVQVSDRKMAELVQVSIRDEATKAARRLVRRSVVIV